MQSFVPLRSLQSYAFLRRQPLKQSPMTVLDAKLNFELVGLLKYPPIRKQYEPSDLLTNFTGDAIASENIIKG